MSLRANFVDIYLAGMRDRNGIDARTNTAQHLCSFWALLVQLDNKYYLLTKSEVITGKSQTKALMY